MDQDNIHVELDQQIANACKKSDIKQLVDILGAVSLKPESDIAIRLRALELQIRLADLYEANYRYLQTFSGALQLLTLSGVKGANSAQIIQQLSNLRETLEDFLKNFGQSLKACIKQAAEPSFACNAIVQKLHDQAQSALIVKLLSEDTFHNQEWLAERSAVTQEGIEEGIWGSISIIDEFVAEAIPGGSVITDEISALKEDIQSGIKVAAHELELAGQGLLPGFMLGGQDGY